MKRNKDIVILIGRGTEFPVLPQRKALDVVGVLKTARKQMKQ